MHLYKFGRLSFILVLFANISVFAQEVKEVQKEHIKVIKAKDIPLDTLALDM